MPASEKPTQKRTSHRATNAIINMTYLMPLAACSIRSATALGLET